MLYAAQHSPTDPIDNTDLRIAPSKARLIICGNISNFDHRGFPSAPAYTATTVKQQKFSPFEVFLNSMKDKALTYASRERALLSFQRSRVFFREQLPVIQMGCRRSRD